MKICYIILERLKEVPETALYRIYTEEKIKYIMRLTDEIEDVRKLEEELGHDTIEFYIQSLNKELTLLEHVKSYHILELKIKFEKLYIALKLNKYLVGLLTIYSVVWFSCIKKLIIKS